VLATDFDFPNRAKLITIEDDVMDLVLAPAITVLGEKRDWKRGALHQAQWLDESSG
jgi:hypothetical protein